MARLTPGAGGDAALVDELSRIAHRAGEAILAHYRGGGPVERKTDGSPVTEADRAAERVILAALRALTPDLPVVAEEEAAAGRAPARGGERFWLVDPLDGTREFVRGNDEFTVNIALIRGRDPALGVVHAPALGRTYAGAGPRTATLRLDGGAARPIAARRSPEEGALLVASRSHGDAREIEALTGGVAIAGRRTAGSSLKFCLVAAGEADLYPRYGPTNEWDTAAGHAVLAAAGGRVLTADGAELRYGKPDFLNPGFVARGLA